MSEVNITSVNICLTWVEDIQDSYVFYIYLSMKVRDLKFKNKNKKFSTSLAPFFDWAYAVLLKNIYAHYPLSTEEYQSQRWDLLLGNPGFWNSGLKSPGSQTRCFSTIRQLAGT